MRDTVVLGGSSNPFLTRSICRHLTLEEGSVTSKKFSNGETSIEIQDSVRGKDVFIVQSGCGNVNDVLIELLIMIAACKTASARRVTAVLPLFPYSRQPDIPHLASLTGAPSISLKKESYTFESAPGTPRPLSRNEGLSLNLNIPDKLTLSTVRINSPQPFKPASVIKSSASNQIAQVDSHGKTESGYKQWIAQNGTLIANLLTCSGADRIITMDLHDPQFQGYFNVSVDNLYSRPLLKHYIMDFIPSYQDCVIVSPDSGGAKRATSIADSLGCRFALIHKERRVKKEKSSHDNSPIRPHGNQYVATSMLVGDVKDKVCVLIDDLVDTSYTITRAAKLLKDEGAKYVYALVTHGVFSGDAINRLNKSDIDKIITTNSVPQQQNLEVLGKDKLVVLDISRILAEAIRRIHNGESVSMLFDHGW